MKKFKQFLAEATTGKNNKGEKAKFLPGVRLMKGRYHAYVGDRHLGDYDTEQQAHKVWLKDKAEKKANDQSIVDRWKKMSKGEREAKI
jgi:hypothetical protein